MSKKNKGGSNLGRTLIKDRFGHNNRRKVDNDSMLHTTEIQDGYDWGRLNLSSVTEESSFQDFLRTAEMAGTEFLAEKLNITFVNAKQGVGILTKTEQKEIEKKHKTKRQFLTIPRRPAWNAETTAESLKNAESDVFLKWRHSLSQLQEDEQIIVTPYEKNLEFWRQLWRVVERSDVVVQIVDARNPLLFRSIDLEKYVKEVDSKKMNLILLNKSDMLTDEQRKHWAEYFEKEGVRTAFFSATMAAEELKNLLAESLKIRTISEGKEDNDIDPENKKTKSEQHPNSNEILIKEIRDTAHNINDLLNKLETRLDKIVDKINPQSNNEFRNDSSMLSRQGLIDFFKSIYKEKTMQSNVTTIGLVGYPNVGKSSTINSLLTQKKVSVSATPGKTKHFQTLFLDSELMLCDCPGLVMPSFVLTKADMILNGILPIDQMRDHVPAVNLLCSRIPRHILEDKYGIVIAKPQEGEDPTRAPFSDEFLLAYGYNRGFMTSNGQPDQSRSARFVCKDYVNGKLLYCVAPPTINQNEYHIFPERLRRTVEEEALPSQQQRAMRINKITSSGEIDKQFFDAQNTNAHVKGRSNFPHIRLVQNDGNVILASQSDSDNAKPWRQNKKEKREKLRKKFSHLDQH